MSGLLAHRGLLLKSAGSGVSGWDVADVAGAATLTFSNGDRTVLNDNTGRADSFDGAVRSLTGHSSGKWYAEIVFDAATTGGSYAGSCIGFAPGGSTLQEDWNNMSDQATWIAAGTAYSSGLNNGVTVVTVTPGDILQLRIEIGVGWDVQKNNAGGWSAGAAFTQATDIKICAWLGWFYVGTHWDDDVQFTLCARAVDQTYAPPATYSPWD